MPTIHAICEFLESFAPKRLAEDWDNVGLLAGDPQAAAVKIMTCLTVTPESAAEAIAEKANLIVSHHPLPFRPLKRLTTRDTTGRLLWELIGAGVAIYSPHTAFDSAEAGINQQLAEGVRLTDIQPLEAPEDDLDGLGAGRFGKLRKAATLNSVAEQLKSFLNISHVQYVGDLSGPIQTVAVACGSAGQFLAQAKKRGCELLITGETNFHTCLEAQAIGMALLLPGHFASERFAVEKLASVLTEAFSDATIWASVRESDPLNWI